MYQSGGLHSRVGYRRSGSEELSVVWLGDSSLEEVGETGGIGTSGELGGDVSQSNSVIGCEVANLLRRWTTCAEVTTNCSTIR